MDWKYLLQTILTPLIAFALRWFFALIGFELDEENFNALVGLLVTFLLGLFLVDVARAKAPKYFK